MLDRLKKYKTVFLGMYSEGLSLGFAIQCLSASIELGEVSQVDIPKLVEKPYWGPLYRPQSIFDEISMKSLQIPYRGSILGYRVV